MESKREREGGREREGALRRRGDDGSTRQANEEYSEKGFRKRQNANTKDKRCGKQGNARKGARVRL